MSPGHDSTDTHGKSEDMHEIARRIRSALDTADLEAFRELLDPDVHWGAPGATNPTCKNRDQVIDWYLHAKSTGVEGRVGETEVLGSSVVVGLTVRQSEAAIERGGSALRWQVYSVRSGLITGIVGFDDHEDAIAFAQVPLPPEI